MNKKIKRSILTWLFLLPLVVIILFPFAVMFVSAIKPADEILSSAWWPTRVAWENFISMWNATNFGSALLNSIYVAVLSTLITFVVSIPAAYAMSRYEFKGQGFFRQFLLVSQMLSPVLLVIGLFKLVIWLGLLDSIGSIIFVYAAFNVAFTVWMLQSYFATIPVDLEEAAWIEGASYFKTLSSVFLPLATPAMVVTAIFAFINSWNEFIIALTMLRQQESYTLPIQIFALVAGRYTIEWHHVMAAALVATIPIAIVFAWLQKYLVRGLVLGAVK